MNKYYHLILLFLSLQTTMPAHAGFWQSFRNSALVTAIFGKASKSEEQDTRTSLPVVYVHPWWKRWFDFSSWMPFRKPVVISKDNLSLSPQAAIRLANSLQKSRENTLKKKIEQEKHISALKAQNKKFHLELHKTDHMLNQLSETSQKIGDQATQLAAKKAQHEEIVNLLKLDLEAAEIQNKQLFDQLSLIEEQKDKEVAQLQSDQNLLMAKLEREERKENEAKEALSKLENNLMGFLTRFSTTAHQKLNATEHKLKSNKIRLGLLTQKLPSSAVLQNASPNPELSTSWNTVPLTTLAPQPIIEERKPSPEIDNTLQIDPVYYKKMVEQGRAYADALNADRLAEIPQHTQQEFLQSVMAIGWHLYDLALQKGQGFTEGTFVIEDQGFKLYNFLMKYSKQQNPDIHGNLQDPLLHMSNNPFAYSRDASHYVHLKNQFRSYGIDVRFGLDQEAQPLLPALKRHILFGKIAEDGDNLIYLKFENYGISKNDVVNHAKEYAAAQLAKNNAVAGSLRYLASYFGYKIETDSGQGRRKERIVPEFQIAFSDIINKEQSIDPEKKKLYIALSNQEGFKTLYYTPIAGLASIKALAEKFKQDPKGYDYMHWRTGQEVILGQHDWVPRLAYNKKIAAAN